VAAPSGSGVFQLGAAVFVTLGGEVSDFDGDVLTYEWLLDEDVLASGDVTPDFGGGAELLPDTQVATTVLGLGPHTIELVVSDNVNDDVTESITIDVIDTTDPTLAPEPSQTILWPPNHKMVAVTIAANAADNSGDLTLDATVVSSEPQEFDGDGNFLPDYEVVSVDQVTGVISLNLRAERAGKGDGRSYDVTITATDGEGNSSSATVTILAPHDRKK